tara:strand:- start:16810 stop:16977 length:168 start_codon:yes stop_codon:yes gene_type:complete
MAVNPDKQDWKRVHSSVEKVDGSTIKENQVGAKWGQSGGISLPQVSVLTTHKKSA